MNTPSENKQDNLNQTDKSKKISRRAALFSIASFATGSLMLLGTGILFSKRRENIKAEITKTPTTIPVTETPTSSIGDASVYPPLNEPIKEISKVIEGISILFDSDGIPINTVDLQGKYVVYDKNEMLELQRKAKDDGVRQVVRVFRGKEIDTDEINAKPFEYSKEKPETKELPKDTLTESELKERGITIVQSTNGVDLRFRAGAFEKGELLEGYEKGGANKLTIVLVPGPIIWSGYMKDQRYQEYLSYMSLVNLPLEETKKTILSSITSEINTSTERIKQVEVLISQKTVDSEKLTKELENLKFELRSLNENYRLHVDAFTDNDWILEIFNKGSSGLHIGGTNPVIFVCVGGETTGKTVEYQELIVDENGGFTVLTRKELQPHIDFVPKISQTYPDKNSYRYNFSVSPDDTRSYPYAADSAFKILSHELTHDWEAREYRKIFELKEGKVSDDDIRKLASHDEYRTDTRSRDTSVRRSEVWINSDYTDNSKQYIVFTNKRGEIILSGVESNEQAV
ncbi:MAG: hypothetical protein WCK31_00985 [bacterium]